MIRIELTGQTRTRQITSKKTGEIITFVEQQAYVFLHGQKYPALSHITVPKGEQPQPAGVYTLSPESFWVNRFGQLEVSPRLVASAPAMAKAA